MSTQPQKPIALKDGRSLYVTPTTSFEVHYCCVDPSNHRVWDAYVLGENGKPCELRLIEYTAQNTVASAVVIKRDPDFGDRGVVQYQRSPSANLQTFHVEYSKEPIFPAGITHTPSKRIQDILNIPAHCHRQLANCSF